MTICGKKSVKSLYLKSRRSDCTVAIAATLTAIIFKRYSAGKDVDVLGERALGAFYAEEIRFFRRRSAL